MILDNLVYIIPQVSIKHCDEPRPRLICFAAISNGFVMLDCLMHAFGVCLSVSVWVSYRFVWVCLIVGNQGQGKALSLGKPHISLYVIPYLIPYKKSKPRPQGLFFSFLFVAT